MKKQLKLNFTSKTKIFLVSNNLNYSNSENMLPLWIIYQNSIDCLQGDSFRVKRLRIALSLLAITKASIGKILLIRVKDLGILKNEPWIEINNQRLLIQDSKAWLVIKHRWTDFNDICQGKSNGDYVFTKNMRNKNHLSRETFTRIVNKHLRSVEQAFGFEQKLTSRIFQNRELET